MLFSSVVPYQEPAGKSKDPADFGSTLSSTMPMAAIFTRNKYIGWASVVFALQNWLGESEETSKSSSTPGYFAVGMSRKSRHTPRRTMLTTVPRRASLLTVSLI